MSDEFATVEELYSDVITQSEAVLLEYVQGSGHADHLTSLSTEAVANLLEEAGDLSHDIIGNPAWVSGFITAMNMVATIIQSNELASAVTGCPEGGDHEHFLYDSELIETYMVTFGLGIIRTHLQAAEINAMLDGDV